VESGYNLSYSSSFGNTATSDISPTDIPEISVTGKIEGTVYRSDTNQPIADVTVILISEEGSGTFEEKIVSVTETNLIWILFP
jgi:hypothetical protein